MSSFVVRQVLWKYILEVINRYYSIHRALFIYHLQSFTIIDFLSLYTAFSILSFDSKYRSLNK
nr:MAG TPA_asm: hypothetical protein [Bacteriophage sp.]